MNSAHPYLDGYLTCAQGGMAHENPYPRCWDDWVSWQIGYRDALDDRMPARTPRVEAQMEGGR
jgi:hypothetical protein